MICFPFGLNPFYDGEARSRMGFLHLAELSPQRADKLLAVESLLFDAPNLPIEDFLLLSPTYANSRSKAGLPIFLCTEAVLHLSVAMARRDLQIKADVIENAISI